MPTITTKDGVEIFYKDWGAGQPIVFSHGWPLSADDWDAQMLFFLHQGFRVIAHDRRGHGRSTQVADGHDMDHYADDLAAVTAHLDLKNAIHVGHSTGGGEVVHYIARHGEASVAKAAIISAVPPLMVQTPANPKGLPKKVFDDFQVALAANRSQFYRDVAAGPFYNYNKTGKPAEATIQNWWRQGMMGGAKAHYDGIVAFSQTDFTEDLKKITVPVLVMHSEDDQIVPLRRRRAAVGKAPKERHAENLQGLPARHADHGSRNHQRRPARVHQRLATDQQRRGAGHSPAPRKPMPLTIYGIKNCDTMKKARAWLDGHGVDLRVPRLQDRGHRARQARRLGQEGRLGNAAQPRRHDVQKIARQGQKDGITEKKAIALMLAQPSMIKRPVLELPGGKLLVGFKPEQYAGALAEACCTGLALSGLILLAIAATCLP